MLNIYLKLQRMKNNGKKRMDRSDVFLVKNTNYESLKKKEKPILLL